MKNKNSKKKPFFASFLEKQIKDSATVTGGTTLPLKDTVTIPEYDSVTKPILDVEYTQKYPSDGDDDVKYAE